jgi:ABC-type glycerol-3-phosphate transport system substrate-binding protein
MSRAPVASLDAGGKVDTREGLTGVERGPVAVVVPPARTASTRSSAEAAAKFLDFMMSTPVQKETLGTFSTQSVNKEVKPTETDELRSFRPGYNRCRRAEPALRGG